MPSETVLKAFLFTDIVGATALKGRIGDVKGAEAISRHDALFRECLARFHGAEHENPGDSFFASFGLPSEALRCALAFQQGMASLDSPEALTARVGIHMGESVRSGSATGHVKLLGLAIDTAARVMELAQAGQILLTRHAFDSVRQQVATAPDGSQVEWRAHGPYRLKGVDHPVEIFEAGITGVSPLTPPPNSPDAQRVVAPEDDETLGWRPAVGLPVPSRESWVLERKLGEGGFGEVWLARHAETEYVRAFKFCFHAERLRSLKREMKLFRLLTEVLGDRPDIARLYEVRLTEPPYFLEMEYTAGGNLADWAETFGGIRNVPMARRLELVAQVGEALTAAHSVGILHKDVKPANILIHEERDGRVQARLTDFGIGELLSKDKLVDIGMSMTAFETITRVDYDYRTLSGTQLYIAPELLAGQTPTLRADIYALGVLLYQMVIGDLNKPLAHGWEALVEDEVLRDDIAACVAGNPEDRLPAADALSHRLRSLEKRRAARRAENRRRSLLRFSSAVAAVLLIIAAASGVGLWQVELARRDAVAAHEAARAEHQKVRQAHEKARREIERLQNEALRAERARADAVAAEMIAQREKRKAQENEQSAQAEARTATERYEQAEAALRHALDDLVRSFGAGDSRTQRARENLIALYEAAGKPEQAARLRAPASQPADPPGGGSGGKGDGG